MKEIDIAVGTQISNFMVIGETRKSNRKVLIVKCDVCKHTTTIEPYRFLKGEHHSCNKCKNYLKERIKKNKILKVPTECPICHKMCENFQGLMTHVTHLHNIDKETFYLKYMVKEPPNNNCKTCGAKTKFRAITVGYHKYCSQKCKANDPDFIKIAKQNLSSINIPVTESFIKDEKIGCLTALEIVEVDGKLFYKCKCDCGEIYNYTATDFRSCIRKNCRSCREIDLEGKKFGRLTVIEPVWINYGERKDRNTGIASQKKWLCECECGETSIVLTSQLNNGDIQSCGCLRSDLQYQQSLVVGDITNSRWNSLISNASARNLEFNITPEFGWNLYLKQDRKCALTGLPIDFIVVDRKMTASLDRINSSKGYTEDNVQWVHKTINRLKTNLSDEDFIMWCKRVANNEGTIKV